MRRAQMLKCWKMSCESQRQPIYVEYCVSAKGCTKEGQKNPRAHKNKIGTSQPPPPPQKPKIPRFETRLFIGMRVCLQKEPKIPDAHKTSAAISGPKIAEIEFYEHGDYSERGGVIRGAWGGGGTGAGRVSGGGL